MSVAAPYMGAPCDWTWEQLEGRDVIPPFKPKLTGPTDLRHFDPTLTCIPPTLSDLVTTERSLHVADFDYVSPEEAASSKTYKNSPDALFKDESVQPSSVEVLGSPGNNDESAPPQLENSTDEEKVMVRNKVGSPPATATAKGRPSLEVGAGVGVAPQKKEEEGSFVEGTSPLFSDNMLVTAEINQS